MNTERDKFLCEVIGGYWHYSIYTVRGNECSCGKWWSQCSKTQPDFSTWEGFGKLWEWSEKQEWWKEYSSMNMHDRKAYGVVPTRYINPDKFADAVYNFLKDK